MENVRLRSFDGGGGITSSRTGGTLVLCVPVAEDSVKGGLAFELDPLAAALLVPALTGGKAD